MEKVKNNLKRPVILKKLETPSTSQICLRDTSSLESISPYFSLHKTQNRQSVKKELHATVVTENGIVKASKEQKRIKKEIITDAKITAGGKLLHDIIPDISVEKQMKWEPKNWQQTVANIRQMRKAKSAPVDTMGCHKCADENVDEKTQRFHTLVALMLSSQTRDQVTFEAMQRLKQNGLTPESMVEISEARLAATLKPVSFYNVKAKNIKKAAITLIFKYKSDIPPTVEELVQLPGVGPKMAHICMSSAWDVVTGIGVDTHVHRISNRLKWVPKETKDPEKTRIELEKWIPFEQWHEVNELLVGFGQTICIPTHPKCGECSNASICPSRVLKPLKKNNPRKTK